jgi:hypothetical protein
LITKVANSKRLVHGEPQLDAVTKGAKADISKGSEVLSDLYEQRQQPNHQYWLTECTNVKRKRLYFPHLGSEEAEVLIFKALGKIPMEQSNKGLNTKSERGIDDPVVKINTGLVDLSTTSREDTGPGDGESEVLEAHVFQQLQIVLISVIEVIGDVTVLVIGDLARGMRECIPNTESTT